MADTDMADTDMAKTDMTDSGMADTDVDRLTRALLGMGDLVRGGLQAGISNLRRARLKLDGPGSKETYGERYRTLCETRDQAGYYLLGALHAHGIDVRADQVEAALLAMNAELKEPDERTKMSVSQPAGMLLQARCETLRELSAAIDLECRDAPDQTSRAAARAYLKRCSPAELISHLEALIPQVDDAGKETLFSGTLTRFDHAVQYLKDGSVDAFERAQVLVQAAGDLAARLEERGLIRKENT